MSSKIERAKLRVVDIKIENLIVERFTASSWAGFGCEVKATRKAFELWVKALEEIGYVAEMHRSPLVLESKSEPEYGYAVFVYVPDLE